jgi:hypothetical protein
MQILESYLKETYSNGIIYANDLSDLDYSYFGYDNDDEMDLDLDFLLETIFKDHKRINGKSQIRLSQASFRESLLKKYGKCVITETNCFDELEAAHIIPYKDDRYNFFINNGLLLKSNIHKTFDKYKWTINPTTFIIEVKNNTDVGEIKKYEGTKVNLDFNDYLLINNLKKRYQDYLKN